MMFESLTGSSCLKKTKDVFSQALMDPDNAKRGKKHENLQCKKLLGEIVFNFEHMNILFC